MKREIKTINITLHTLQDCMDILGWSYEETQEDIEVEYEHIQCCGAHVHLKYVGKYTHTLRCKVCGKEAMALFSNREDGKEWYPYIPHKEAKNE